MSFSMNGICGKAVLFASMVLLPMLFDPGRTLSAQEEEVQLIGFSADGAFAAVRKTFKTQELSDKVSGVAKQYSLQYIIRLSDGEIAGVYQGEGAAAKSFSGAKESVVKPAKEKFPIEYLIAAPLALFKKAAKILAMPAKEAEVREYPLTFIVPDKGVEASKTDHGIQAKAMDDGKHKVRLMLERKGKESRMVGKWTVMKKTSPCECCADKTQSRTESLDLDLYWGPAVPLVLWKRTVSKFFCPDVQIGGGTTTEAGWTVVDIQ